MLKTGEYSFQSWVPAFAHRSLINGEEKINIISMKEKIALITDLKTIFTRLIE